MFVDARSLATDTIINTSLCIIGAGAAGITLARQAAKGGRQVCLIEGGGFQSDAGSRGLYVGRNTGQPYGDLDDVRLRYFGGTTNHWSGYCRRLDTNDFLIRPWIPNSGWPFDRSELEPYYARAADICDLASERFDIGDWLKPTGLGLIPFDAHRVIQRLTQFSPPTRFGIKYRAEIDSIQNLTTYLHANLTRLETVESGRQIVRAHLATLTGVRLIIVARQYVLACGGLENPRLLLLSEIGNDRDLVGRFFMEHTNIRSARMLLHPDAVTQMTFYQIQVNGGLRTVQGGLGLTAAVQRYEQITNVAAMLEPYGYGSPENPGVLALRDILDAIERYNRPVRDNLALHVQAVLANAREVSKAILQEVFDETPFQIRTLSEQVPNPDSRVMLGDQVDALGLRRVRLHWKLTELDKRSIMRTVTILAMELGRLGMGRVRLDLGDNDTEWPDQTWWGYHHMGTTRMHQDPGQGVVDAECRVHGVSNLYVAGSSVFPTSGSAAPTLTIVALALRLAKHLETEIGR